MRDRPGVDLQQPLHMPTDLQLGRHQASGLVDVLDRVLDKGLVIAGDIKVSLAEVELLTVRIRLIVCSIDKAQEIGLDWWKYDHHLAPGRNEAELEKEALRQQVRLLERKLENLTRSTPARRHASRGR
ncbi:MAG TPA: gas vesicle protein [Myxococcales bacterium]|nr:gas vesicle protein [Myxococcales bacterium]